MALQHVMKEYKGRGGKAPYIPDLGTRWSTLTVEKELVVGLGSEAGCQLGAVAKLNPRPEIRTPVVSPQPATVLTEHCGLRPYYWGPSESVEVCYELKVIQSIRIYIYPLAIPARTKLLPTLMTS
jgi:hypothetical protein